MPIDTLSIPERFCGPPRSGNGGYVCGCIARDLKQPVAVRLKAPPPLETPLRREPTAEGARLLHGETVIGEARPASLNLKPPPAPSFGQATQAAKSFSGFSQHSFPSCFVCGPARSPDDGLCIFAGPLNDGSGTFAAPWTPHVSLADESGRVKNEFIWAALDCPGSFAVEPRPQGAMVLGELAASITGSIHAGGACVVTAWYLGQEGRKHIAGTALHGADGGLVAVGRAVWIEVPLSTWG